MEMTPIFETTKTLGASLLTLSGIIIFVMQYLKDQWGLKDKKAEIVSLVIGFVSSGLVGWAWIASLNYQLELWQWIGLGFFIVMGTISPSGGYKFIGTMAGQRNQE